MFTFLDAAVCNGVPPVHFSEQSQIAELGTMQGNIASWKKKEGEEIAAGDSIAEIETDKVRLKKSHIPWYSPLCLSHEYQ